MESVAQAAEGLTGTSGQVAFADLSIGGAPCRFVAVVPPTSAVRLRGALADRTTEWSPETARSTAAPGSRCATP